MQKHMPQSMPQSLPQYMPNQYYNQPAEYYAPHVGEGGMVGTPPQIDPNGHAYANPPMQQQYMPPQMAPGGQGQMAYVNPPQGHQPQMEAAPVLPHVPTHEVPPPTQPQEAQEAQVQEAQLISFD